MVKLARLSEKNLAFLLLAPAVGVLSFVTIGPFIYTVWVSLHIYNLSRPDVFPFVGFSNYVRLLTHPEVQGVLMTSATITTMAVGLEFLFGLGLALLVNREFRLKGIVRSILMMPMMIVPIVVGLIFNYMLQFQYGVVDFFLELVGLQKVFWLNDPTVAVFSVVISDVWQWTPFMFATMLAGLTSIPTELYDAADVDGASPFQSFRHLTFPMLTPVALVALVFRLADSLRLFDLPYIMTMGGPGFATSTISFYSFKQGLFYFDISVACTMDTILLIVMIVIVNLLIYAIRKVR